MTSKKLRLDLQIIANMIGEGEKVLDVGCGNGELIKWLRDNHRVDARGIELSWDGVNHCVSQGLAVIQGDADRDLETYPTKAFDAVVLSQTIQATQKPYHTLDNLLKIGRKVIVSIPNFGHWRVRLKLMTSGCMPVTGLLRHQWYDTPNIHLCTIKDFINLSKDLEAQITHKVLFGQNARLLPEKYPLWLANLTAEQAVFCLNRVA